jgi:hypothetical protein
LNRLFQKARAAGDAILDPHGHLLDRDPTARSRNHFPWLVETPRPATQSQWEAWMERALDHQTSVPLIGSGRPPSFVITASPVIEAASGTLELYTVFDAANAVVARHPAGLDCWVGVSVDRTYLRDEPHLTRLINTMLASGAQGFVFRASHTQLGPVDDSRYLEGLREVVRTCALNGIPIFLPNSGWVGWLAMAWGAWGFSGGMAATSWVDKVPGPMSQPDEPALPYFERQLLRSLRWRYHEQVAGQPGYQPCPCSDCVQMGSAHDLTLAKRHQLRLAHEGGATLTRLSRSQRRTRVADRLDRAISFRDSLPPSLGTRVGAAFLDRWRALV